MLGCYWVNVIEIEQFHKYCILSLSFGNLLFDLTFSLWRKLSKLLSRLSKMSKVQVPTFLTGNKVDSTYFAFVRIIFVHFLQQLET